MVQHSLWKFLEEVRVEARKEKMEMEEQRLLDEGWRKGSGWS
jgi:hypothetical protein